MQSDCHKETQIILESLEEDFSIPDQTGNGGPSSKEISSFVHSAPSGKLELRNTDGLSPEKHLTVTGVCQFTA